MHTKRMRFLFGYLLWFWELKTHQNRPNDNDCRWRLRFRCEHIQSHWWLHIFLHNINSIATLWCTQPSFFFLFVRLCCSLDCRTEVRVRVHQSRDIPTKQQSTCQITTKIRWKTRLGSIFPRHTRKKRETNGFVRRLLDFCNASQHFGLDHMANGRSTYRICALSSPVIYW